MRSLARAMLLVGFFCALPVSQGNAQEAKPSPPAEQNPQAGKSATLNFANGNSFFDFCREAQRKKFCTLYVQGFLDGSRFHALSTRQKRVYCEPKGSNPEQALDIVLKFMTDNPTERHRDARFLALVALKTAWPCPNAPAGQPT